MSFSLNSKYSISEWMVALATAGILLTIGPHTVISNNFRSGRCQSKYFSSFTGRHPMSL